MEMQRKGTSTYRLSMGSVDVLLKFRHIFFLLCGVRELDCFTWSLKCWSSCYLSWGDKYNVLWVALHVLSQGSHYSCWKQVWPALWELHGNHSSHYEPIFWDRDVCWGAALCFVFLMIVHRCTQIVNHLLTMIIGFLHVPDCPTSLLRWLNRLWNCCYVFFFSL